MNYYLQVLQNYATFSGRARRSEYWYFVLFNFIFSVLAVMIGIAVGASIGAAGFVAIYLIYLIYQIAILIPSLAVIVRRLHDVGKSGWYFFISFIPLVGIVWLIVLLVTEGEPYDNQYGANPKELADELIY